jgi:hypothetical protein
VENAEVRKEAFSIALVPVKKLIKSRTYMQPERAAGFGRCICQRKAMIAIVGVALRDDYLYAIAALDGPARCITSKRGKPTSEHQPRKSAPE